MYADLPYPGNPSVNKQGPVIMTLCRHKTDCFEEAITISHVGLQCSIYEFQMTAYMYAISFSQ